MDLRLVATVASALVIAACQFSVGSSGCTTQIDWVDFIEVGSIQYVASPSQSIDDGDLGPVVAHVRQKLSGNVCDPNYRPKDGDAAFLEPGTAIYQLKGRPPNEALAARHGGRLRVYEPVVRPTP